MEVEEGVGKKAKAIVRDIRRYYCEFCGICRSKKSLIASHVHTHHKVSSLSYSLSIRIPFLLLKSKIRDLKTTKIGPFFFLGFY